MRNLRVPHCCHICAASTKTCAASLLIVSEIWDCVLCQRLCNWPKTVLKTVLKSCNFWTKNTTFLGSILSTFPSFVPDFVLLKTDISYNINLVLPLQYRKHNILQPAPELHTKFGRVDKEYLSKYDIYWTVTIYVACIEN